VETLLADVCCRRDRMEVVGLGPLGVYKTPGLMEGQGTSKLRIVVNCHWHMESKVKFGYV
jgi:hypothetical protein